MTSDVHNKLARPLLAWLQVRPLVTDIMRAVTFTRRICCRIPRLCDRRQRVVEVNVSPGGGWIVASERNRFQLQIVVFNAYNWTSAGLSFALDVGTIIRWRRLSPTLKQKHNEDLKLLGMKPFLCKGP